MPHLPDPNAKSPAIQMAGLIFQKVRWTNILTPSIPMAEEVVSGDCALSTKQAAHDFDVRIGCPTEKQYFVRHERDGE